MLVIVVEDDPQGGVAKIIMRELGLNRQINALGLGPGSVAIDIGAHVGIVSIWLAKRYPGIKFVKYEAFGSTHGAKEKETLAALRDKLKQHKCDAVISGMGC